MAQLQCRFRHTVGSLWFAVGSAQGTLADAGLSEEFLTRRQSDGPEPGPAGMTIGRQCRERVLSCRFASSAVDLGSARAGLARIDAA
jgi:hypothetical protein